MNFGFEPGTSFTSTSVPFWRISYFDPDLASQRPFGMFLGIGACVIKRARGKRKNFIVAIILHRLRWRQAEADRSRRQCGYIPTLEADRKSPRTRRFDGAPPYRQLAFQGA